MAKNQIRCPKCNRFVREGTVYCPYCEEKIEAVAMEPDKLTAEEQKVVINSNPYKEVKTIGTQPISLQQILQGSQSSNEARNTQPKDESSVSENISPANIKPNEFINGNDNIDDEYYVEDDMPEVTPTEPVAHKVVPEPAPIKQAQVREQENSVNKTSERPLFRREPQHVKGTPSIKERYEEQKLYEEDADSVMSESISDEESEYDENGIYNPNYDHYYDDVLPEVIADIHSRTKEIILKAIGAVAGIFLIIVLLLYYLS